MTANPAMAPDRKTREERGFALLIVLWTIILLALLVTHLTATGRGETRLAGNLRTAAVMEAAADGAVFEAIFHVLDSSAGHWPANGATHRIRFPDAVVDLSIGNEAGKLNVNTVQPQLLQALLHVRGVDTGTAASIAAAVSDWRFPDAQGEPTGTKAQRYRDAGRDYGPPGKPFETMEELGLVLGMTPAILARIAPYLSVYRDGDPDTRYAAAPVLQAFKEATGTDPVPTTGPPDERVVTIAAIATRPDRPAAGRANQGDARFVRRAVVRIGARAHSLFQILTWDSGPG